MARKNNIKILSGCCIFVFAVMYAFFKVCDKLMGGIRVAAKDEIEGLDMPEMGIKGYDDTPVAAPNTFIPAPEKGIV